MCVHDVKEWCMCMCVSGVYCERESGVYCIVLYKCSFQGCYISELVFSSALHVYNNYKQEMQQE